MSTGELWILTIEELSTKTVMALKSYAKKREYRIV
jgi:hypothetical protein